MRPKKVILCVDDNEQDLSVLSFMLSTNGYRVLVASTGKDAIDLFVDNSVELVLADHLMPGMAGDRLIFELKTIAAHIPMVLMGDLSKMTRAMADALISKKHCSPTELLECVKNMSARKRGPRKGFHREFPVKLDVLAVVH